MYVTDHDNNSFTSNITPATDKQVYFLMNNIELEIYSKTQSALFKIHCKSINIITLPFIYIYILPFLYIPDKACTLRPKIKYPLFQTYLTTFITRRKYILFYTEYVICKFIMGMNYVHD